MTTTADKGSKTVVIYKDEYRKKMKTLLEDKATYKIIKTDPTTKLITTLLQTYLKTIILQNGKN